MRIDVVHIADRLDLAPAVAAWVWQEWGRHGGHTLAEETGWIAGHDARSGVNQCFVVVEDGVAAAVATLEEADLDERPDLSPWLANVFVAPGHRGRGHAARLVRQVEATARASGVARLYLHTESAAGLYVRLGWTEIGHATHRGHPVTIMARDLG
jgi:GNAT superfamily N-acetyltransferase